MVGVGGGKESLGVGGAAVEGLRLAVGPGTVWTGVGSVLAMGGPWNPVK